MMIRIYTVDGNKYWSIREMERKIYGWGWQVAYVLQWHDEDELELDDTHEVDNTERVEWWKDERFIIVGT